MPGAIVTTGAAPAYRAAIISRECSVLIYDEAHPVNYIASCQVMICGDMGFIHTVDGPQFYAAMRSGGMLKSLMTQIGILTLEACVIPAHERLMRAALREVATVEVMYPTVVAGHRMVRVKIVPC